MAVKVAVANLAVVLVDLGRLEQARRLLLQAWLGSAEVGGQKAAAVMELNLESAAGKRIGDSKHCTCEGVAYPELELSIPALEQELALERGVELEGSVEVMEDGVEGNLDFVVTFCGSEG